MTHLNQEELGLRHSFKFDDDFVDYTSRLQDDDVTPDQEAQITALTV